MIGPLIIKTCAGIVELRLVELGDACEIVRLRSLEKSQVYLSASVLTEEAQREWINQYKARESLGSEYYFMLCRNGTPCGTIRLYDIAGDSFQWGSWIIEPGQAPTIAPASCVLIYDFGFQSLNKQAAYLQVRLGNASVLRFHQFCGARVEREDAEQTHLIYQRHVYDGFRSKLLRLAGIMAEVR